MASPHKVAVKLSEPHRIGVYPNFTSVDRKENLQDGPWFCEDDNGRIAYVSEAMKKAYMGRDVHAMFGYRR